eukprot:Phypoly_transcript_15512.p1 GENE.Phypoly_transcript_15512~~Phypoly_transcript_15512.p1  ORF type:complete len:288 (+),score=21.08 Phypoly_transcript_15512:30-866(+)
METIVVVQGDHSLSVPMSDVLKYPKSFLALCSYSQCVHRDKYGAIIVQERNPDLFPLVVKYYTYGKIRIPCTSIDLESVKEELSFWFPGEKLDIQYKDPVFNLAYTRRLKVKELIEKEKEGIRKGILARAQAGYLEFRQPLDNSLIERVSFFELVCTYHRLLGELFPTDQFYISSGQQNCCTMIIFIWRIKVGTLGQMVAKKANAACKTVLGKMAEKMNEECIKGSYRVDLSEVWGVIPQYFFEFFATYLRKKSTHKFTCTFSDCFICWSCKELENVF